MKGSIRQTSDFDCVIWKISQQVCDLNKALHINYLEKMSSIKGAPGLAEMAVAFPEGKAATP